MHEALTDIGKILFSLAFFALAALDFSRIILAYFPTGLMFYAVLVAQCGFSLERLFEWDYTCKQKAAKS